MSNYQKSTAFSNSAFYHEYAGAISPQDGMNLLEYFTAKAMQGLCVNAGRSGYNNAKDIASFSVEVAKETLILLEEEYNKP